MASLSNRTPQRLLGVLNHDQPFGAIPTLFVSREEAQYLLDCQFAWRRARWLIVLKKPLPLKLRDQSCSIRENTIIAAASGSRYHRALIQEAWG